MTCEELQNELSRQNIQEGDFVQVTLISNNIITGSITSGIVSPEITVNKEKVECRIGVHEGNFTVPTTILAKEIIKIIKIQNAV